MDQPRCDAGRPHLCSSERRARNGGRPRRPFVFRSGRASPGGRACEIAGCLRRGGENGLLQITRNCEGLKRASADQDAPVRQHAHAHQLCVAARGHPLGEARLAERGVEGRFGIVYLPCAAARASTNGRVRAVLGYPAARVSREPLAGMLISRRDHCSRRAHDFAGPRQLQACTRQARR
jgi:hypothetical protein